MWLSSVLGPQGRFRVASFASALAWGLHIRRRVVVDNLANAFPGLDGEARRSMALGAYRNMVLTVLESILPVSDPCKSPDTLIVDDWKGLDRLVADGKPALLAAGHFGNWERLGEVLAVRGFKLNVVVRPLKGALNDRIVQARYEVGAKLIDQRGALKGMLGVMKRGEVVYQLIDQSLPADQGVFVPFFGRPTCTTPSVSLVALRTGAPVYVIGGAREGERLRVFIEGPVAISTTGDRDADVKAHTAELTRLLEGMIRRYPDQWLWLHRRWKVQPLT